MTEAVKLAHAIKLDQWPIATDQLVPFSHKGQGLFVWDPSKIKIFKPREMLEGSRTKITGESMQRRAVRRNPCNANILDHLLAHPELIPEEWRKYMRVHFWGTLYKNEFLRDRSDASYVRGLSWEWYGDSTNPIHRWVQTNKSPAHEHWYSDDCAAAVFTD